MKIFHAVTILGLSSASPIDFLSTSTQFVLGKDYEVECRPDGIMLTSTTGQFLLTDRAEDADKHCKEVSHWNKYGGSMFIPDCLAIKESTKIWYVEQKVDWDLEQTEIMF